MKHLYSLELSTKVVFCLGILSSQVQADTRVVNSSVFCNPSTTLYINVVNPSSNKSPAIQKVTITFSSVSTAKNATAYYYWAEPTDSGTYAVTGANAIPTASYNNKPKIVSTPQTSLEPGHGMQAAASVNGVSSGVDVTGASACYVSISVDSDKGAGYVIANGFLNMGGQLSAIDFNGNRPF